MLPPWLAACACGCLPCCGWGFADPGALQPAPQPGRTCCCALRSAWGAHLPGCFAATLCPCCSVQLGSLLASVLLCSVSVVCGALCALRSSSCCAVCTACCWPALPAFAALRRPLPPGGGGGAPGVDVSRLHALCSCPLPSCCCCWWSCLPAQLCGQCASQWWLPSAVCSDPSLAVTACICCRWCKPLLSLSL